MKTLLHLFIGAERGGCETTALALIRGLPEWKHSILVLGPPGPISEEFVASGAVVHHLNLFRPGFRKVIVEVRSHVAKTCPESVVAWHGMVLLPEILRALKNFGGSVFAYGGNPAHRMPRSVDWYYFLREKVYGVHAGATYVCCSNYVADSFSASLYLRRFPRVAIPNGIREPTVTPQTPRVIDLTGAFTIGMVARLDPIKDHETLLRSFARLIEERPSARLEIAGDGELRQELEDLAGTLGISASVRFLGMLDDVYQAMSTWDLFVYATTEQEGLGSALAEAMMIGLPCVVTDVGPMREVTGEPPVALMVPPRDPERLAEAILNLISNHEERKRLGTAARLRALDEFDARVFALRYRHLLDCPPDEA